MSTMVGEEQEQEMRWQAQVWNHIDGGFANSIVLKCAADLSLFDTIHAIHTEQGKPVTPSTIVRTSPNLSSINPHKLFRLLRFLAHMKLLNIHDFDNVGESGDEVGFSLTDLAKFLLRSNEKNIVDWVIGVPDEPAINAWHQLPNCISYPSEGPTPFEKEHGKTLWEFARDNPEMNKVFNDAMACDTRLVMPAFIEGCKDVLKGISSLVDVGGGTGTAMNYVVKAFPHIKCKVYDLPHVITTSPEYPGIELVGGDMFQSVPKADAVILKFMLHNWQNEGCVKILQKCKEAVPKEKGKVIIIDVVIDQDEEDYDVTHIRLSLDVDMMGMSGGRERTKEEWRVLMKMAGFSHYDIIPIFAMQSVIVAYP
ncbi:hypothetical protein Sjap_011505 [Stephania japonica]|uniref:O-methyltransferase n=1 Tax=Stephania japonica TaxID=461633 RepID=A0AAP0P531_9MAGN|nr:COMT protein [Stephania japonica]